jgi:hypothetical protein
MPNLSELVQRGSTNALCGRIRCDEFWVFLLKFNQFTKQLVVYAIGNLRLVLDVIEVVMTPDLSLKVCESISVSSGDFRRGG